MAATRTMPRIAPLATVGGLAASLSAFRLNRDIPLDLGHSAESFCGKPSGSPLPCTPTDPGSIAKYPPKPTPCPPTVDDFYPWLILDIEGSMCPLDPEKWQEAADEALAAGTAEALTRELELGELSGSTSLQSEAYDLTNPAGASHVVDAIQALKKAFRTRCHGGAGTIIIPECVLDSFTYSGGPVREVAGSYRAGRCPVQSSPGATGVGPDATGNIDATAAGEFYIYGVCGAVEYNVGEISAYDPGGELIHPDMNRVLAEAKRRAVFRFGGCGVFAVRVCTVHEVACCPVEPPDAGRVEAAPASAVPDDLDEMTVEDVLDVVGSDASVAKAVALAEADGRNRKTLLAALDAIEGNA